MTSDTEMSRCCVCYNTYNRTNRAPISMPCGHTFCHGCIRHMTTGILFSCGVCRTVSPVGWNGTQKNVALIQALEKLNLLAPDDTDEVLDSTPLGANHFLADEINNVDSKNMLYHGKQSLKVLSGYLETNYDDPHGALRPIHAAINLLECMQEEEAGMEVSDSPMIHHDLNTYETGENDVPSLTFRELNQHIDGDSDFHPFDLNSDCLRPFSPMNAADRASLDRRITRTWNRLRQLARLNNADVNNDNTIFYVNHGRHGSDDIRGYRRIVDSLGRVRIAEVHPQEISNANRENGVTCFHDNLRTVDRNDEALDIINETRNGVNDATNTNLRGESSQSVVDDFLALVDLALSKIG